MNSSITPTERQGALRHDESQMHTHRKTHGYMLTLARSVNVTEECNLLLPLRAAVVWCGVYFPKEKDIKKALGETI